jgi:hypothetical protein
MTREEFIKKEIESQKPKEQFMVFKEYVVNIYEQKKSGGYPFANLETDNFYEAVLFAKKMIEKQKNYRPDSEYLWVTISKFIPIEERKNVRFPYDEIARFGEEDIETSKYEFGGDFQSGVYANGGSLIGNQKRIDLNKNGKIDAEDFKLLRTTMNGAWRKERKYVNSSNPKEDYEVIYARKYKPSRKGYKGKTNFATGGGVDRFSEYSNDALYDMIINLSRYENTESDIQMVKDAIVNKKADEFIKNLKDKGISATKRISKNGIFIYGEKNQYGKYKYETYLSYSEVPNNDFLEIEMSEFLRLHKKMATGGGIDFSKRQSVLAYKDNLRASYFVDKTNDGYKIIRHTGSVLMPFGSNKEKDFKDWFKKNTDSFEILYATGGGIGIQQEIDLTDDKKLRLRKPVMPERKYSEREWAEKFNPRAYEFMGKRKMANGGDLITETADAIFYANVKNGKIKTSFGDKTKEGLLNMLTNVNYDRSEIVDAIFDSNEKNGKINTGFGAKTKEGLSQMIKNMQNTFANGGAFAKLSNRVAKNYEGKRVKPQYQKEYGKVYSKSEAKEVGDKVAGKVKANQKMATGGGISNKLTLYKSNYLSTSNKQVLTSKDGNDIYIYENEILYDSPDGKTKGASHRMSKLELNILPFTKLSNQKMTTGGATKKGGQGGIMVLAKQIRKDGESWKDALKRAGQQLK